MDPLAWALSGRQVDVDRQNIDSTKFRRHSSTSHLEEFIFERLGGLRRDDTCLAFQETSSRIFSKIQSAILHWIFFAKHTSDRGSFRLGKDISDGNAS
jgi:hypothetical protein